MEYTHHVQKWNGHVFVKEKSTAMHFFSLGAYLDGDDDIEDIAVETIEELYRLWQEQKASDKACGEKGWQYRFYKHDVEPDHSEMEGNPKFIDYIVEGKVYCRGNKVFFKPL